MTTSRGPGSGSRLRLYHCLCIADKATGLTNKVRVASDTWQATCKRCKADYVLQTDNPALAINVPGPESEA